MSSAVVEWFGGMTFSRLCMLGAVGAGVRPGGVSFVSWIEIDEGVVGCGEVRW